MKDLIRILIADSGKHKELLQCVYVLGYSVKEISKITKRKEVEVKRLLDEANLHILKKIELLDLR